MLRNWRTSRLPRPPTDARSLVTNPSSLFCPTAHTESLKALQLAWFATPWPKFDGVRLNSPWTENCKETRHWFRPWPPERRQAVALPAKPTSWYIIHSFPEQSRTTLSSVIDAPTP